MSIPRKQREVGLYRPVWQEFNRVIDYLHSLTINSGRGIKVTRGVNGTTISADIPKQNAKGVRQFRLVSIQNDFYTCKEWDGQAEFGDEVYIARPFEHRVSNFNGQSIAYNSDGDSFTATYSYTSATKRTKTISGTAETQVLIPLFKTGFTIIYAMEVAFPITVGPSNTPLTDPNDEPITLIEWQSERAWTKV